MRYVIQDRASLLFWTGDRWSEHIGEAMEYTKREAVDEARYLRDRMNLKLRLVRPIDMGGDD